jgi:hypothetical protein
MFRKLKNQIQDKVNETLKNTNLSPIAANNHEVILTFFVSIF